MTITAPLVVVGSVNADIYVEVDKLPKEGETIVAKSGHTFAGGKGANQAACAARLSYPTYLVGQVLILIPERISITSINFWIRVITDTSLLRCDDQMLRRRLACETYWMLIE